MAQVDFSVAIRRPVEEVFAVLSDPRNSPKWSSSSLEMEIITPGKVGVGSRRRGVVKGIGGRTMENVAEVTGFEPNRRIEVKSIIAVVPFRMAIDFRSVDGGTRVDWRWDLEPRGLLRPLAPLVAMVVRRGFRRDLANLKALMESGRL